MIFNIFWGGLPALLILTLGNARAAEPPRLDVLCAAYLSAGVGIGERVAARDLLRRLSGPLAWTRKQIAENKAQMSLWARFKDLVVTVVDEAAEQYAYLDSDLNRAALPRVRRELARATLRRLLGLVGEVNATPASALPVSHVLRGAGPIQNFLYDVRGTAERYQREVDRSVAEELATHDRRATAARERAPRPGGPSKLVRAMILGGAALLATGVSAILPFPSPSIAPIVSAVMVGGLFVKRHWLFAQFERARVKVESNFELRRIARARRKVLVREEKLDRAYPEFEAIEQMIDVVNREDTTTQFALYSHTVDLPMPFAKNYLDDPPLAADAMIDAIRRGHVPFIGGRRARLTHVLFWENDEPVLVTVVLELIQPGIADLYRAE